MSPAGSERVTAVVVAHGAEPWLERSVDACLGSAGAEVDVVVVDNGCTDGAVDRLATRAGVTVVRPGRNLGFAGGCNLGVRHATGDVVALVNPDALVAPDALAALAAALGGPGPVIATALVELADPPGRVNTAGNELHPLGLSWCGGFGDPVGDHAAPAEVLLASGAGMALRRDDWDALGGFCDELFAYYEDADLSLRAWQAGGRVVLVPEARITHRYEFSRHPAKLYLLDRNRMVVVLTTLARRTLVLLAPLLVAHELALTAAAVASGWGRERGQALAWVARHRRWVAARRRAIQGVRRVGDGELWPRYRMVADPANVPLPRWAVAAQAPVAWLLRAIGRLL